VLARRGFVLTGIRRLLGWVALACLLASLISCGGGSDRTENAEGGAKEPQATPQPAESPASPKEAYQDLARKHGAGEILKLAAERRDARIEAATAERDYSLERAREQRDGILEPAQAERDTQIQASLEERDKVLQSVEEHQERVKN
jgi:hypothetical protein